MPTATSQGLRVHYLDEGRGTPVVMLHSGGMSSRQWSRLIARFTDSHRAMAIDMLGSGASDPVRPDASFHFTQDLAAVDAVLADVSERYHLVGHSYGGLLALTAARAHPERVRSLSVYEPVVFGVLHSTGDAEGLRDLATFEGNGRAFDDATGGDEAWLEGFIGYWNGPGAWRALPESSRAAFLKTGRKVFLEVRSLMADRTPHTAFASLDVPTLVMRGAKSTVAARHVCEVLARTIPRAVLHTIPDAGHMGPLTHAQAVNDLIVEHVRTAESGPSAPA